MQAILCPHGINCTWSRISQQTTHSEGSSTASSKFKPDINFAAASGAEDVDGLHSLAPNKGDCLQKTNR